MYAANNTNNSNTDAFTDMSDDDWTVGARTPRTWACTDAENCSISLGDHDHDRDHDHSSSPETIRPSPNTHITGITYETPSGGRQVRLFYQTEATDHACNIVQALLHWNTSLSTWEKVGVSGIKVRGPTGGNEGWPRPKRDTPLAVVSLGNGKFIWLFYIEREWGMVAELRSFNGGETWTPGDLCFSTVGSNAALGVPARGNSQLSASLVFNGIGKAWIYVWYQDVENSIRQLVWTQDAPGELKWKTGYIAREKGYGGTSIASLASLVSEYTHKEWLYYQGLDGKIVECFFESGQLWATYYPFNTSYPLQTPITALLAYPHNDPRVFLKSSTENNQKRNIIQEWHTNFHWQERKMLPLSNYIIKNNDFVALNWMLDRGETEMHIFAVDSCGEGVGVAGPAAGSAAPGGARDGGCGGGGGGGGEERSKVFVYVVGDVPAAMEVVIED